MNLFNAWSLNDPEPAILFIPNPFCVYSAKAWVLESCNPVLVANCPTAVVIWVGAVADELGTAVSQLYHPWTPKSIITIKHPGTSKSPYCSQ